jgi:Mitochondrial carrier protein
MKISIITILLFVVDQAKASQRSSIGNTIAFRSAPTTRPDAGFVSATRRSVSVTDNDINHVQNCAVSDWSGHMNVRKHLPHILFPIHPFTHTQVGGVALSTLARGAFLRVASDLSGGTPLESIKCRVTATQLGPIDAFKAIVAEGGYGNLWAGSYSRTIEGSLLGALFLVGATAAKKQTLAMGGSSTMAALTGGLAGGLAQAIVMTPAGMVFTSLNLNRGKKGYENDNAITVTKRIFKEKGLSGMFIGGGPMCVRQATNWMSRSYFTEVARTTFKMSKYGLVGEIGSGVIGGLGSCWNTPVETIRVYMQADVSAGRKAKTSMEYWRDIKEEQGYVGLFRGVTPRGVQAIWQTVFMVVVPNVLGL